MTDTDSHNRSAAEKFNQRAAEERLTYLQFIYRLGTGDFPRLFTMPGTTLSLWWSSLVVEKSPLKSDSFQKLITRLTHGVTPLSLLKRFKSSACYHLLRGLFYFLQLLKRQRSVIAGLGVRSGQLAALKKLDYLLISYFPHLDAEQLRQGRFVNRYLPALHKDLAQRRSGRFGHICIPVDIDGYNFHDAIRLADQCSEHEPVMLVEELVSTSEMFSMLGQYLRMASIYLLNRRQLRKNMRYPTAEGGLDIWPQLRHESNASFCGAQLLYSLYYSHAFQNLTAALKPESTLVTICEMQAWERCLYYFARKHGIRTVAYQHTIVPMLLLNYFNAPEEPAWDANGIVHCPQPDFVATVGNITADLFRQHGWPSERVFVWGAQRFDSLRVMLERHHKWDCKENRIVCAFSICPQEALHILRMLAEAFKDMPDTNLRISLKSHPSLDVQTLAGQHGIQLPPEWFEFTTTPLDQLMQLTKAMIVTESSATFYALAAGCRIIVPRFNNRLDCNPLSFLSTIGLVADSAVAMRNVCSQAVTTPPTAAEQEKAAMFLADYFHFPENDLAYLNRLDQLPAMPDKKENRT